MNQETAILTSIKGIALEFRTAGSVFSPKAIDRGTLAMLSVTDFNKTDKVLDLGCGYGAVGILAAKLVGPENVVMTDIDQTAVELAIKNAQINHTEGIKILQSDGFAKIDDKDFTVILVNPPYHTDFSVAKRFIEKGFNRLCIGGRMMIVTKRMNWYKNKLTSIFGGTGLYEIDGYFVFAAVKRNKSYANAGK